MDRGVECGCHLGCVWLCFHKGLSYFRDEVGIFLAAFRPYARETKSIEFYVEIECQ